MKSLLCVGRGPTGEGRARTHPSEIPAVCRPHHTFDVFPVLWPGRAWAPRPAIPKFGFGGRSKNAFLRYCLSYRFAFFWPIMGGTPFQRSILRQLRGLRNIDLWNGVPPHDRPEKRKSVRKTSSQKCIFGPPSETQFWDGWPRRPGAARPEHRKNVESAMRSTNSRDFTRVSPGSALPGGPPSHAQQGFH